MTPQRSDTLLFIVIGGLIVYTILGLIVIRRWVMARRSHRPASARANPEQWVTYWLPLLIVVEIFALGGGVFAVFMLLVALPADQMQYTLIGAGGGLAIFTLFLAGFDALWVARVRALRRQQPADRTD